MLVNDIYIPSQSFIYTIPAHAYSQTQIRPFSLKPYFFVRRNTLEWRGKRVETCKMMKREQGRLSPAPHMATRRFI